MRPPSIQIFSTTLSLEKGDFLAHLSISRCIDWDGSLPWYSSVQQTADRTLWTLDNEDSVKAQQIESMRWTYRMYRAWWERKYALSRMPLTYSITIRRKSAWMSSVAVNNRTIWLEKENSRQSAMYVASDDRSSWTTSWSCFTTTCATYQVNMPRNHKLRTDTFSGGIFILPTSPWADWVLEHRTQIAQRFRSYLPQESSSASNSVPNTFCWEIPTHLEGSHFRPRILPSIERVP